jgi:cell division control protein 45
MGAILDLPSEEWFGEYGMKTTVHIIDSSRPQNLSSLFGFGENGERIVVWDDGGAEDLIEERKSWEALMVGFLINIPSWLTDPQYEPEPESDDASDLDSDNEDGDEEDYALAESGSAKRRSLGDDVRPGKRRKVDANVRSVHYFLEAVTVVASTKIDP